MKKISKLFAILLALSLAAAGCGAKTEEDVKDSSEANQEDPNINDYTYVTEAGTKCNLNDYYGEYGVECDVDVRGMGGAVNIPDEMTTDIPKIGKECKIGFSIYYTVDEVGAMILETLKADAKEAGIELLVNDANYDQNAQNQAIEQWILEGVNGVIICPCDFTGVKPALDALKEAAIPVVSINAPLAGSVDSIIMSECVEQGKLAGETLEAKLLEDGEDLKGEIVIQTLPFVHPNAATRIAGFKKVFEKYPGVKMIELTGTSPEDHYTAFEGAMQANPNMLGAFGLYASATIGMNNAKKAAGKDIPLTSIDNDKLILAGIYNGEILGSASYSATVPANWAVTAIVNKLNGVEIPGIYYYPNTMVTKDNVEEMFSFYYGGQQLKDYMSEAK